VKFIDVMVDRLTRYHIHRAGFEESDLKKLEPVLYHFYQMGRIEGVHEERKREIAKRNAA
jgi:hypothetical protein